MLEELLMLATHSVDGRVRVYDKDIEKKLDAAFDAITELFNSRILSYSDELTPVQRAEVAGMHEQYAAFGRVYRASKNTLKALRSFGIEVPS